MPTHAAERQRTRPDRAAKSVAGHASAIMRLELRLALLELRRKLAGLGLGAGLAAVAVLLGVATLAFALASVTAGIATALPVWGALLVMTGFLLFLTAAVLVFALRSFRQALPPTPELAVEEARLTREALKADGDHRTH